MALCLNKQVAPACARIFNERLAPLRNLNRHFRFLKTKALSYDRHPCRIRPLLSDTHAAGHFERHRLFFASRFLVSGLLAIQEFPKSIHKGKLRLRQVTRLTEDGHQTPIVTSCWDLRAIVIAYRMFERWRQENFFKYLREEYLIDALVDYQVEPDDPTRLVPNPARKALDKELRLARAAFTKLQERFGVMALDDVDTETCPKLSSRKRKRNFAVTWRRLRLVSRN
jgi:hypothetical protein